MSIYFFNEDVDLPKLSFEAIKKGLKSEIRINSKRLGTINIIFCSDDYLYAMNVKFLNHDSLTDVITFDYTEDKLISGDIFVSTDRVLNNSSHYQQDFYDELIRVISHGLLHLLNFNDKETKETLLMREKESNLLERIKLFI
jgi:rRNA maturation RNase YbeY